MSTSTIVGGVMIGVAGLLMIIVAILYKLYSDRIICKKRKRHGLDEFWSIEDMKRRIEEQKIAERDAQVSFGDFDDKRFKKGKAKSPANYNDVQPIAPPIVVESEPVKIDQNRSESINYPTGYLSNMQNNTKPIEIKPQINDKPTGYIAAVQNDKFGLGKSTNKPILVESNSNSNLDSNPILREFEDEQVDQDELDKLHKWLFDGNQTNLNEAENVLFGKKK